MRGALVHGVRLLVLVGMIGLEAGQVRAQATAQRLQSTVGATHAASSGETAVELLYQGKILPIVTDVFNSINNLGTGLNDRNVSEISKAADEFAGEQQRFEAVKPVPTPLHGAALNLDKGLHNLTSGTRALAAGLQSSDNNSVQQAANVLQQGLKQFQTAVSQVRRLAGPLNQPSSSHATNTGGPVPTPIIKGLP